MSHSMAWNQQFTSASEIFQQKLWKMNWTNFFDRLTNQYIFFFRFVYRFVSVFTVFLLLIAWWIMWLPLHGLTSRVKINLGRFAVLSGISPSKYKSILNHVLCHLIYVDPKSIKRGFMISLNMIVNLELSLNGRLTEKSHNFGTVYWDGCFLTSFESFTRQPIFAFFFVVVWGFFSFGSLFFCLCHVRTSQHKITTFFANTCRYPL